MYDFDVTPLLWAIALVSAVAGWCVIEALIWLFSHLSIGWIA